MRDHLNELESKTIYILREVRVQFKNPAFLCSFGKDSVTMLYIAKKAFGEIPFPVVHLDTGFKFPEMYAYRDRLQKELGFKLIIARNEDASKKGMGPEKGHFECCNSLKTDNLKQVIAKYGFDAFILGIRRDEHGIRAKERYFSPRDNDFKWKTSRMSRKEGTDSGLESLQDSEMSGWDLYASVYKDSSHVRIHPLLHWSEIDVWSYIKRNNIKVNPMYFAKEGKRFRSLGCMPCTAPMESNASTVEEIIKELEETQVEERHGRLSTKEHNMEKLRSLGYM
ncbi:MAG: sulfate adenylyltransferase subunit CysD [Candidatus Altiarchaeales archaeon]|nr:sulfate adenylyltransferase subunit CysD [Candidatus Altiarchaeales archaeon]